MAEDDLVGNIATELVLDWCGQNKISTGIDQAAFARALQMAGKVFI
jgi:hypothetical protein